MKRCNDCGSKTEHEAWCPGPGVEVIQEEITQTEGPAEMIDNTTLEYRNQGSNEPWRTFPPYLEIRKKGSV